MTRRVAITLLSMLALAACGADGAPEPVGPATSGVTIGGSASIGVRANL